VIDTRPFSQLLELYLEKDSNGDFATLNNPAFKLRRHEALARLLDELQSTLLSVPLGKDARQALLQHLQGPVIFANNPPMEANRLVRDSIRLLVMSPEYWVQR
jgi:hypothetical protein